jgi:ArsR family transcriptional regulator
MTPRQAAACCRPIDRQVDEELFRALSDPTRLSLLTCLAKCARPCTVTELAECCHVDFSVVSRHLALLERAGALESSKHGRSVHYRVRYSYLADTLRSLASAIEQCAPNNAAGGCCGA